ncbi:hypothetical protein PM082_024026 [Marasmius tenuissimus]|nr:hypothetical protein PM082_024026 [Marasmius tenuissimus]
MPHKWAKRPAGKQGTTERCRDGDEDTGGNGDGRQGGKRKKTKANGTGDAEGEKGVVGGIIPGNVGALTRYVGFIRDARSPGVWGSRMR